MWMQAASATIHRHDTCDREHPAPGRAAADHRIGAVADPASARPYRYSQPDWPARAYVAVQIIRFSFAFRGFERAWRPSSPRLWLSSRALRGRCRNRHRAVFLFPVAPGCCGAWRVCPDVCPAGSARGLYHAAPCLAASITARSMVQSCWMATTSPSSPHLLLMSPAGSPPACSRAP